jgi:Uma2 family endonuclease
MNEILHRRLTVSEFVDWAETQPGGRYELVDGRIIRMAPERALHILAKVAVVRVLQDAIAEQALPCIAYGDGMTVKIDEHKGREPDALVQCGAFFDPQMFVAECPLIVVEVLSPSTERVDRTDKLVDYFTVDSIQHYLVVDPVARTVTHHARAEGATIRSDSVRSGEIVLAPPGLAFSVDKVFASLPA